MPCAENLTRRRLPGRKNNKGSTKSLPKTSRVEKPKLGIRVFGFGSRVLGAVFCFFFFDGGDAWTLGVRCLPESQSQKHGKSGHSNSRRSVRTELETIGESAEHMLFYVHID